MTSIGNDTMTDGQKIQAVMKQTQQLFRDVGALLSTSESIMDKHGWVVEGNTSTIGVSGVIDKPKAWLPFAAFRFFFNESLPNLLAFICVILNDEPSGQFTVSEPVITAGVLYFDDNAKKTGNWDYWYAWWYGWARDFNTDHLEIGPTVIWKGLDDSWYRKWKEEGGQDLSFKTFKVLALPLVEIRSGQDIETKVVSPLISFL